MPDGTSSRLDRVSRPDPRTPRARRRGGREALYSTSPEAGPALPLVIGCNRCGVERGVRPAEVAATAVRPPVLLNPFSRKVWARCPTCHRRAWLRVRMSESLRVLLDRPRGG